MLLSSMLARVRFITVVAIIAGLLIHPSRQQTSTSCDPVDETDCPADKALGTSVTIDFTTGESSYFTAQSEPAVTYDSTNGATFTIQAEGDAPQLNSDFYIMFGKYEVTMKVAAGAGIVSTIVLESADLDEIDWEMLGAVPDQGQTNYFGKGVDSSATPAYLTVDDTTTDWHTYGVEWTDEQIVWSVDGAVLRTVTATAAGSLYPQTPCQLKIGVWAAGASDNAEGTIAWADGPTDFADAPFIMYVRSVAVTDYSTGSEYKYLGESGTWESIEAVGGKVNGNLDGAETTTASVTAAASVAASASATVTYTSYPGLPSGWSVNPTTGMVIPGAAATEHVPLRLVWFAALAATVSGCWLGFGL